MQTILDLTTLYFRQGSSDKVYIIEKAAAGNGFVVNFAYGRRGSTLSTGTKTACPVSEFEADQIYRKLLNEKKAKGYTEGVNGGGYAITEEDGLRTNVSVQLLNPIEEHELEQLFQDDEFAAQQKHDGERNVLVFDEGNIYGINRKGLRCGIPEIFKTALLKIAELYRETHQTELFRLLIDGETIKETFYAFDLLEENEVNHHAEPFLQRWERLHSILALDHNRETNRTLICCDLVRGETAKRELFAYLETANLEGIVFKKLDAPYEAGSPNSRGNQLKYKFYEEATCLVAANNRGTRSIGLQVREENGTLRGIGNCGVPVNHEIPPVGTLVEIRYMYAFRKGSLFQPRYKGKRCDKTEPDLHSSLKFKPEPVEEEHKAPPLLAKAAPDNRNSKTLRTHPFLLRES